MSEITGPIIAITLVLLSVFVPVAFIPGITGQLFQQFAVAVSVSMLISAINALTLSPALCAVFLSPSHGPKRGPMGYVLRGIDRVRDGYASIVRGSSGCRSWAWSCSPSSWLGAGWLFKVTPTGFLPDEDQGAIFSRGPAARGRLGQPHRGGDQAVEEICAQHAGRRQRHVGRRLQPARRHGRSPTARF